jgi:hypothetical protein
MMFEQIDYFYEETAWGTWRRFLYENGERFAEYRSHLAIGDLPLVHYTYGKCPETGKRIIAHGVFAVGRMAWGIVAIGQASLGVVAIGQLAIGIAFGLGQAATGAFCFGQLALGLIFGLGQFTTGQVAIGQFAFGKYVLAQFGLGEHVIDMRQNDALARQAFGPLLGG